MTQDLLGGQIDVYLGAMGSTSTAFISNGSGKLKLLSIISPERLPQFKDAPATHDTESLEDFTYSLWIGLFVRKETPDNIVQALHHALDAAMSDPAVKKAGESAQFILAKPQSQAQADTDYANSIAQYRGIAKSIGFKPE